jgi:catechol 2,3-dioxygenase-like lactoylglutathione lyase family enzyme
MIDALDHVTIVVPATALSEAVAQYEGLLGCGAERQPGRASLQLSNLRLDLVAEGESWLGLAAVGFAVEDLERLAHRLSRRGLPASGRSHADPSAPLVADLKATHGVPMRFCQRRPAPRIDSGQTGLCPQSPGLQAPAVLGLDHLVIRTPNPERAIALYAGRLDLSLRLDRSHADWGTRLLFFRCGDLVIELAHDLKAGVGVGPDRLWGLSWRVGDCDRTHACLRDAGLEVSAVRAGRRPGTRVFTVRSHTARVPTLMIGPQAPPPHGA